MIYYFTILSTCTSFVQIIMHSMSVYSNRKVITALFSGVLKIRELYTIIKYTPYFCPTVTVRALP